MILFISELLMKNEMIPPVSREGSDITIENIKLSDLTQSMMICSVIIVTMILLTVVPVIMISLSNDEIRRVND